MRQIPIALPEVERLYRDAGVAGWVVAGADEPPWDGAVGEELTGVHAAAIDDVLARVAPLPAGVTIRAVDPDDERSVTAWVEIFITAFAIEGQLADAWRRFGPILARSKGEHWLLAALDGRDVAAAATFTRRRVAWLGGGAVLPEARGRGIQRALIAERARQGAQAGSHRITATADVGTVSARNLEALGMRRIWTRALYRVDPARPTMRP
jgi:GNAT superfamily N-acetyltransferase